eukprot:3736815-Rhodomonas_salina.2
MKLVPMPRQQMPVKTRKVGTKKGWSVWSFSALPRAPRGRIMLRKENANALEAEILAVQGRVPLGVYTATVPKISQLRLEAEWGGRINRHTQLPTHTPIRIHPYGPSPTKMALAAS